ncbi:hypothetical protein GLP43_15010 [Sulfitobacter sp. M39]|uniref:hypothetical protein n=1 Tax=Sulfitobacter sp. M39 TaxID=2675334 RepID=UPI001F21FDD5|nr:hypothetical protein [Sulfitobacter sp. M39]MCF7748874.1 hypothetical protein [Sulfitobacter sp. M39]
MNHIEVVGETILLDGQPLSLVTQAGVAAWVENGIEHSCRHDQVRDPLSGNLKYRRLYEKDGADVTFVLVGDCDNEDGARVLV